jgi:hypothetical protein
MSVETKIIPNLNLENIITFKNKRKLSENTDDNISTEESRNIFKVKVNKILNNCNNSKLILNENKVRKTSERSLNNYVKIDNLRKSNFENNDNNESLSIKLSKFNRQYNNNHSSTRKDFYGNRINKRKKHKITFADEIHPNKKLAKIIYVESYKKYNAEVDDDTDECCGSKCVIF